MCPENVALAGCTPRPLSRYLQALGVLRIVSLQADEKARGAWEGGSFVLHSTFDSEGLCQFFMDEYRPTPIIGAWAGDCGFFTKDGKRARGLVRAVEESSHPRLASLRESFQATRAVLAALQINKANYKDRKDELLTAYRARLPDEAIQWLDTAWVLSEADSSAAPILGSGGNDGRLDFSRQFLVCLQACLPIPEFQDVEADAAEAQLMDALFERGSGELLQETGGQYDPGGVGGPNSTTGYEGTELLNPWAYLLQVEGSLLFAGAMSRRVGRAGTRGKSAFPFTVRASHSGANSLSQQDSGRGELWLPIWSRPASLREISRLFAEGRAQLGRRQARTGLEFARAAVGLGIDRGVDAFERYGLLVRNGRNNIAVPLGRLRVTRRPQVHLVDQVDPWLNALARATSKVDECPARYHQVKRRIEDAIHEFCLRGGTARFQGILRALGRGERQLGLGGGDRRGIPPLQHLRADWIRAADDGSSEYRIALALSSVYSPALGSLRQNLEPVERDPKTRRWRWVETTAPGRATGRDLSSVLSGALMRRCLSSSQAEARPSPADGRYRTTLQDIDRFLRGDVDDRRIEDLLWALMTIRWRQVRSEDLPEALPAETPHHLCRLFALVRLLYLSPHQWIRISGPENPKPRPDPGPVRLLVANRWRDASRRAYQLLRGRGLSLPPPNQEVRDWLMDPNFSRRIPAALLIPLWEVDRLVDLVSDRTTSEDSVNVMNA